MDALAVWRERDLAHALHPADRRAIEATSAARRLVVDLFAVQATARDLYNACATLGRLLGAAGASPSLAAGTIENAARAIGAVDPELLSSARASLVEGFTAAIREDERTAARASWDDPVVLIDAETVAIRARPDGDAEWAGRIASRLARRGVRRAFVDGPEPGRGELASALALVGIPIGVEGPLGFFARARRLFAPTK